MLQARNARKRKKPKRLPFEGLVVDEFDGEIGGPPKQALPMLCKLRMRPVIEQLPLQLNKRYMCSRDLQKTTYCS